MSHSATVVSTKHNTQSGLCGWVVGQFGNPSGFWGHIVGVIMSRRLSNRRRNAWTVGLLDLKPGERVLEVGFGPGLALRDAVAEVGRTGFVAGIDRSHVMLAQAVRRNTTAVAEGRMDLRLASVEALPDFDRQFDAIFAVNSIGFWSTPARALEELRDRLAPEGRIAITVQPRTRGATAETSARVAEALAVKLRGANFDDVVAHALDLVPPAVCVAGKRGC